uniref:Deformed epidermal autoregulatory factor 1 n=1 Tax=Ciona savignyi TaxID=51511 RepID=H2YK70_CIOSA
MSDSSQTFPRTYENGIEVCTTSDTKNGSSVVENDNELSRTKPTLRTNDDSVFITATNSSNQIASLDKYARVPLCTTHQCNLQLGIKYRYVGSHSSGGHDDTNSQTNGSMQHNINPASLTLQSPMKTLFVMSPNIIKGLNLQQVPVMSFPKTMSVGCSASSVLVPKISGASPKHDIEPSSLLSPSCSGESTINSRIDIQQHGDLLPVTCRKNRALLDKRKLGSGQRGKCILFNKKWMTPSQFEVECGLSMSKDWKRSIRYGGNTVQKLINEGLLRPHSAVCTCAVCSDDNSVTCPIRLFQPYKRRKRSAPGNPYSPIYSPRGKLSPYAAPDTPAMTSPGPPNSAPPKMPQTQKPTKLLSQQDEELLNSFVNESDADEEQLWWQLDVMSDSILEQANRLKTAISEAKTLCKNRRIEMLRSFALKLRHTTARCMLQHKSSDDIDQPSTKNPDEVSNASCGELLLAAQESDIRSEQYCRTCGKPAISECTGCHRATYCSTYCQEKDWLNGHSETCQSYREDQPDSSRQDDVVAYVVVTSSNTSHSSSPLSV